ncbi:hypothetical protein ACIG56_17565 [Nocardia fusca]|uniref:hypothetical protein n=1 Tax=Nocardia fusca TaxID=941183 RepID=UPI0037CB8124
MNPQPGRVTAPSPRRLPRESTFRQISRTADLGLSRPEKKLAATAQIEHLLTDAREIVGP